VTSIFKHAFFFSPLHFDSASTPLMGWNFSPGVLSVSLWERSLIPPMLTLSSCAFVRACKAHFKMLLATCFSSANSGEGLHAMAIAKTNADRRTQRWQFDVSAIRLPDRFFWTDVNRP